MVVYRLQNFEPPAQAALPAPTQPGAALIPGLPPEIQTWVQQGMQGMCALQIPGLPPVPGCGAQAGAAVPTAPVDAPRFEGARILAQAQVMDPKIREQIVNIMGFDDNYGPKKSPCMYPELGISFMGQNPPANVLVSFSCNQIQARNFQWPHADSGLKDDTVVKFKNIVQQLFGGG